MISIRKRAGTPDSGSYLIIQHLMEAGEQSGGTWSEEFDERGTSRHEAASPPRPFPTQAKDSTEQE